MHITRSTNVIFLITEVNKQTSKMPPIICNCAINAKSPQVQKCFKRVKFRPLEYNAFTFDATARKTDTLTAPCPCLKCLLSRPFMWIQNTCCSVSCQCSSLVCFFLYIQRMFSYQRFSAYYITFTSDLMSLHH